MPLLGGALIGVGAVILMAGLKRIAGFSGILGQILGGNDKLEAWRFVFIAGVLAGPFILYFMGNKTNEWNSLSEFKKDNNINFL